MFTALKSRPVILEVLPPLPDELHKTHLKFVLLPYPAAAAVLAVDLYTWLQLVTAASAVALSKALTSKCTKGVCVQQHTSVLFGADPSCA